jgi:hypothetical protein
MQPRRRAIGATALAAVAVLVIIAVAGGYWAYASVPRPNPGGTMNPGTTSISTGTLTSPPSSSVSSSSTDTPQSSSCGSNVTLEDSNSNGSLYVSSNAEVGDSMCMTASLNDSPQVHLSIINSSGNVMFSGSCVATPPPGAPPPTGDTCTAYWDTASPDPQGNPIEPGAYRLTVSDFEGSPEVLETNFTLSSATTTTQQ